MGTFEVREAADHDAAAIAAIYDHQVDTGIATFDERHPPVESWLPKIGSPDPGDHFLVGVDPGGGVAGFAYSSAYRARSAYRLTKETTIYLAPQAQGQGLGPQLYDALLTRMRADGMHVALALIARPNPASEGLHRRFGYEQVGLMREVGLKFGRWIDTGWWALRLGEQEPLEASAHQREAAHRHHREVDDREQ